MGLLHCISIGVVLKEIQSKLYYCKQTICIIIQCISDLPKLAAQYLVIGKYSHGICVPRRIPNDLGYSTIQWGAQCETLYCCYANDEL